MRQDRCTEETNLAVNKVANTVAQLVLASPHDETARKCNLHSLLQSVSEITSKLEVLTAADKSAHSKVTPGEYEKEYQNLKGIISNLEKQSKIDTEALVKFQVKCLEYDAVVEEREVLKEELQSTYQKLTETQNERLKWEQRERDLLAQVFWILSYYHPIIALFQFVR